jgi:hypothetical protein
LRARRANHPKAVQPCSEKYFASLLAQIIIIGLPSRPNEGRFAIVTNAGWDAMDATASSREEDRRAGFP